MKRRSFIQTITVASLGLSTDPSGLMEALQDPIRFLKKRTDGNLVFPRPLEGQTVDLTPPGFVWLPADGAEGYRIEVRRAEDGQLVYGADQEANPEHRPDEVLETNTAYTWDVLALDGDGEVMARRGEQSFSIGADVPELPWVEPAELLARAPDEHPRLIYTPELRQEIQDTIHTSRKESWKNIKSAADEALELPPIEKPKYPHMEDETKQRLAYGEYFGYFRDYLNNAVQNLGLAYMFTGKEEYADRAKKILLEVATWPRGWNDFTSVKWGPVGDEVGLSLAQGCHRAYDWLYDSFTEEERDIIRDLCRHVAGQVHRRLHEEHNYLTYSGGSHPARIMAYLSEMGIVLRDEVPEAEKWFEYSMTGLTTFYPHWGGSEGGWAEGIGYGLWYNLIYTPAFEGLRLSVDYDLWRRPFFRKVRYFFFYCSAIRGEMRPFGDGAEKGGPSSVGAFAELTGYHAQLFDDPQVGWYAQETGNWRGGPNQIALVHEDALPVEEPTGIPQSRVFSDVGWAGLHSDLSRPDTDTFFLFKSSPYGSVSHSHADQNSFAIMKGGHALAIPSGYYGPSYGSPHHAEWTRSTKANNSVLVNGEGQVIRESDASGRIVTFENQEGYTYLLGDAEQAYYDRMERFDRHVLFLRPGLFLLLDDLAAPEPARFQWMLHALEEMRIDEEEAQIVSTRHGTALDVRLHAPAGLRLRQTNKFDTPFDAGMPEDFDEEVEPHWHVTAETVDERQSTRIGALMGVHDETEAFEIEPLARDGWFGARATGDFGSVEGWVQVQEDAPGPDGFGAEVAQGEGIICGRDAGGAVFQA